MNCSALFSAVLCMHLRAAMLPFSKGFKQFHSSSGSGVSGQKAGERIWLCAARCVCNNGLTCAVCR